MKAAASECDLDQGAIIELSVVETAAIKVHGVIASIFVTWAFFRGLVVVGHAHLYLRQDRAEDVSVAQ